MTEKIRNIKNWCSKDGLCNAPHKQAMKICFYYVPLIFLPPGNDQSGICLQYSALKKECLNRWAQANAQNPALYTHDRFNRACRAPITEVKK
ncbi:MAG TPA: hypothetical protein PLY95_03415 [Candidatus Paceibacterota bacterium]|nr:hypothetical protein [Smithellaceae bacterium]HQI26265.1 hypothetical protein [Candidatus Paceibacterota bacterium]